MTLRQRDTPGKEIREFIVEVLTRGARYRQAGGQVDDLLECNAGAVSCVVCTEAGLKVFLEMIQYRSRGISYRAEIVSQRTFVVRAVGLSESPERRRAEKRVEVRVFQIGREQTETLNEISVE